jgi:hypothetical protein
MDRVRIQAIKIYFMKNEALHLQLCKSGENL